MSGRDLDIHRIRSAHHDGLDPETAERVMDRKFRTARPRERVAPDPRPVADPAAIADLAASLARVALVPGALAIPCPEHDAAPGRYCLSGIRYVCMPRVWRAR